MAVCQDCVPLQYDGSGFDAAGTSVTILYLPLVVSPLIGGLCGADTTSQGELQDYENYQILFHRQLLCCCN